MKNTDPIDQLSGHTGKLLMDPDNEQSCNALQNIQTGISGHVRPPIRTNFGSVTNSILIFSLYSFRTVLMPVFMASI